MSESGEGSPVTEEAKSQKGKLNEFDEIQNERRRPTYRTIENPPGNPDNQKLASQKIGIAKSTTETVITGDVGPVSEEAKKAKPAATFEKTEEVVRKQTTPPGQALNKYSNSAPPQTGQHVDKKA